MHVDVEAAAGNVRGLPRQAGRRRKELAEAILCDIGQRAVLLQDERPARFGLSEGARRTVTRPI